MAIRAFDTPIRRKWLVIGLSIGIAFPFFASGFMIHLANLVLIACFGALPLNMLMGNTGLFSLGQAGFMAVGAFGTWVVMEHLGAPIWAAVPLAALLGALMGFIAGLPALRLRGIYMALSTLALYYIIHYLCSEYQFVTQGNYGFVVPYPSIGPFTLASDRAWYFYLMFMVGINSIFTVNLLRTRVGRAWSAIRDRDIAAEAIGVNIGYYKVLAFVVSSAIVAAGGFLNSWYANVISVDQYSMRENLSYLAMVVIGGLGSVMGSLIGAAFITLLPYGLLHLLSLFKVPYYIERYFFIVETGLFGLLIILFLLLEPGGLLEIWRRIRSYFELWPFKSETLTITKK